MKSNTRIFLLILLALTMVFSGCEGLMGGGEPEITIKTITDVNDEDFPKDTYGNPLFPEGTRIDFKKVVEDDKSTTDYTATWPDGTVTVFHQDTLYAEGGHAYGNSTSTTTFSASNSLGKKSEVKTVSFDDRDRSKGHQEDVTITTVFLDGSSQKTVSETEMDHTHTSFELKNSDGKKVQFSENDFTRLKEEDWVFASYGQKVMEKETSTSITYDAEGNPETKIEASYENPGRNPGEETSEVPSFYNYAVITEYTYVNGEPEETKCTEHLHCGCDSVTVTVPNTDGTKTITITIKDIPWQGSPQIIGTGDGTVDANGKKTVTVTYTNGIENKTVTEDTTVTEEILTDTYYEKTITEDGVITSQECEYFYDEYAGIVFKTVTTYSNGTPSRKSNINVESGVGPAQFGERYVKVPNPYVIYDNPYSMTIWANGGNSEQYTIFYTKIWDGPSSKDIITEYPHDDSVEMRDLHFPPES